MPAPTPVPSPVPVPTPMPTPMPSQSLHCPWATPHTGAANTVLCSDGTLVLNWQCVKGGHGQRVQCPRNLPVMCAQAACGGGRDYCCSTDCSNHSGQRACERRLPGQIPTLFLSE